MTFTPAARERISPHAPGRPGAAAALISRLRPPIRGACAFTPPGELDQGVRAARLWESVF